LILNNKVTWPWPCDI